MLALVVAEGVAIALLTVLVVGLLRSHALILKALHELGAGLELEQAAAASGPVPLQLEPGVQPATRPPGTVAGTVTGTTLHDEPVVIDVQGPGRRTLLAFLSSGCSVCHVFWAQLAADDLQVPGGARLVVVVKGAEEESPTALRRLAGARIEVVQSSGAWTDYGVPGSPYFVYVEDGQITGEGSSTSWAQVRDLMGQGVDDVDDARDVPRADRELLGAGIHPGHPSLYTEPDGDDPRDRDA